MSTLGDRIKIVRGEKTQKEFAALLGVSRDVLANWETGRARPSTDDIVVIANTVNVTTDYLLCLVDNPKAHKTTVSVDTSRQVETLALSRSDNPDDDLPEEALQQIEDFKQYMRLKHKKPD